MTPEYLNECFIWDYEGNLTWKERPRSHFNSDSRYKQFITQFANKPAGCMYNTGYRMLTINGKRKGAHIILYMLYHDMVIPDGMQIDHQDVNKLNNTFKNLRLGTSRQNTCNTSKRKNNTSGFKGVSYHKSNKKYEVKIRIGDNKRLYLGYFATAEEAHEAYKAASVKYHGEFSNFG